MNNSNEGVLHIPQSSRAETSPSDAVCCHTQDISSIFIFLDRILTGTNTPSKSGPGSNGGSKSYSSAERQYVHYKALAQEGHIQMLAPHNFLS